MLTATERSPSGLVHTSVPLACKAPGCHGDRMADLINLRRARKAKALAEAAAKAAENRALYGRTKVERDRERLQAEQDRRRLDALKRDEP